MVVGVVRVVAIQIHLQGGGLGLSKKQTVVGVVRVGFHFLQKTTVFFIYKCRLRESLLRTTAFLILLRFLLYLWTTAFLTNVVFVFPFLIRTTVVFIHKCCLSFPLIFCRPLYFQKCCHHFPLFWQNTILFFYKCHLCFPLFCRPLYFLFTNVFFVFHFFMDHCIFKTNVVFVFYFFLRTTAFSLMLSSFSLLY